MSRKKVLNLNSWFLYAALFMSVLSIWIDCSYAKENLDSIDKLQAALAADPRQVVAFFNPASYRTTHSLFRHLDDLRTDFVANNAIMKERVLNGQYLAASVDDVSTSKSDENKFNVLFSGIVSPHAIFMLPDQSDEHPYGANASQSRRQLRNAINIALMQVQYDGIEQDLAAKYGRKIIDVKTCKLNNESISLYPLPNRKDAQGLLKQVLDNGTLLVGAFQNDNETTQDTFFSDYMKAILDKFASLSGPDGVTYGRVIAQLVYAKSSAANLMRSRIHITEPYFLVDNTYSGTREPCQTSADCVKATATSNEECSIDKQCQVHARPYVDTFQASCFTYGSETLFITLKRDGNSNGGGSLSGGAVAGFVLLTLTLLFLLAFIGFVIFRERVGHPLFYR